MAQQMRNQSGRGGFAVGAGNRHKGGIGTQLGPLAAEEFDIADDFNACGLRYANNLMRHRVG